MSDFLFALSLVSTTVTTGYVLGSDVALPYVQAFFSFLS
jgi:hypothetical protein